MNTKQNPAPLAGGHGATSEEQPALNSTKRNKSESRSARLHRSRPVPHGQPIDFDAINRAALAAFPAVLARILPGGKRVGTEFVALNPRRADRHLGSFKVNRYSGRWSDFATGDKGGDPISLVAYVANVPQSEAARLLAQMLGIGSGDPRRPPATVMGLAASRSKRRQPVLVANPYGSQGEKAAKKEKGRA
jgi:hypothetical protein